tara:strand:+ start:1016 stop:3802 length:2787 start_codon:yes stop_codon:yes gene_type:complete
MSEVWTSRSGSVLASIEEQQTISIALPINGVHLPLSSTGVTIQLISGSLPQGMRLNAHEIVGTPYEVRIDTVSTFVVRATVNNQIYDRTFKIIVTGPDDPTWRTAEGTLPVGPNNTFFIIDSAPLDFQLDAYDPDVIAGDNLEYYIKEGNGELPPGIQLTTDGRLVGIVEPILALEKAAKEGRYDEANYGNFPYDFAARSSNGYDSFYYDTGIYDINVPTKSPRKLNRNYEFTVSVSDGDNEAERTFMIYVVGDDFLKADNTLMQVANGVFTADITNVRVPIWLTPANLGFKRANNYVTVYLDVLDPNTIDGIIYYELKSINDDNSESILPPGLSLDSTTGELAGKVPYQPAITKEYKFTIEAIRFVADSDTVVLSTFAFNDADVGSTTIRINKLNTYASYAVGQQFTIDQNTYSVTAIDTESNLDYDTITINKGLVNKIEQSDSINLGTIETSNPEESRKTKTFSLKLLGEVDSTITWNTNSALGTISANYISTLSVKATTTVPNARLLYTLESGSLPPGLILSYDGEIIGKVNSFGTATNLGITVFDSQNFKLDNNTTTLDRDFEFTVKAKDQYGYSAITRKFYLSVTDPDDKLYSNLYMRPLLKNTQRIAYEDIISDTSIFDSDFIYRPNDKNFGLQKNMQMLLYGGIETKTAEYYVSALAKNIKRKKYNLGEVKTAIAKNPGSQDIVYEIVYVEVIDPAESANGNVRKQFTINNESKNNVNSVIYESPNINYDISPSTLKIGTRRYGDVVYRMLPNVEITTRTSSVSFSARDNFAVGIKDSVDVLVDISDGTFEAFRFRPVPENTLKVDSNAISIDGGNDRVRYISSIQHVRDAIRLLGETEANFLPLWMKTTQPNTIAVQGYTKALPLCYCKPGTSNIIKNAINARGIKFNQFDFDIDRVVIDSTTGNSNEQYIAFANFKINV